MVWTHYDPTYAGGYRAIISSCEHLRVTLLRHRACRAYRYNNGTVRIVRPHMSGRKQ